MSAFHPLRTLATMPPRPRHSHTGWSPAHVRRWTSARGPARRRFRRPAADGALEQDVADKREIRFGMVEDDVAGRVAGAMADVQREIADGHLVTVGEPARRLERAANDAVARTVLAEAFDPEPVFFMRS